MSRWSLRFLLLLVAGMVALPGCGGSEEGGTTVVTPAEATAGQPQVPSANAKDSPTNNLTPDLAVGPARLDLPYLTDKHLVAVIVHPQRISDSRLVTQLRKVEVLNNRISGAPELLMQADRIVALVGKPDLPPEDLVVVVTFAEQIDRNAFLAAVSRGNELETREEGERTVYIVPNDTEVFFFHDEKTVVVVDQSRANVAPTIPAVTSELATRLSTLKETDLAKDVVVLAELGSLHEELTSQLESAPIPPVVAGLVQALKGVGGFQVTLDLDGGTPLALTLRGVDDEASQQLEGTLQGFLAMGKGLLINEKANVPQEHLRNFELATEAVESISITRDEAQVSLILQRPAGLDAFIEMLPETLAQAQQASRRVQRINQMKHIALAMLNHHDAFGRFPPVASRGQDGKALLSWRVAILPFLEEASLNELFDRTKPWNSEINKNLTIDMPLPYGDTELSSPEKSDKAIFVGKGTPFTTRDAGPKLAEITDGASNTILFIEIPLAKAEIWTKPHAIRFDPKDPLGDLGEFSQGEILVAFFDGSIRFLPADLPADVWRRLIQHQDGEPVDREGF